MDGQMDGWMTCGWLDEYCNHIHQHLYRSLYVCLLLGLELYQLFILTQCN